MPVAAVHADAHLHILPACGLWESLDQQPVAGGTTGRTKGCTPGGTLRLVPTLGDLNAQAAAAKLIAVTTAGCLLGVPEQVEVLQGCIVQAEAGSG